MTSLAVFLAGLVVGIVVAIPLSFGLFGLFADWIDSKLHS